jgi:prophage regulatory protein
MPVKFIRRREVCLLTGKPSSTLYENIREGLFTSSVNLGGTTVGWPESEVEVLNAARLAGASDEEVRELVAHLEAQRPIPWVQLELEFPELANEKEPATP